MGRAAPPRQLLMNDSEIRCSQLAKNIELKQTADVISKMLDERKQVKIQEDLPTSPRETSESVQERVPVYEESTDTAGSEGSEEEDFSIEEQAYRLFETKPKKAVEMLTKHNILKNTPKSIAKFLYNNPRLSGTMVGDYLGEPDDFNLKVLDAFIDRMDLTDMDFDQAIRKFMFVFHLPGEAQKISRIMSAFAGGYYSKNSKSGSKIGATGIFKSEDSVFLLAYSVIMLNTDLHSMNVKTKMTKDEFINRVNNTTGPKEAFPKVFLGDLYQRILEEEIRTKDDKYTKAAKRGYLFQEKRVGLRHRKKQVKLWWILDPETRALYSYAEKDEVVCIKF